MVSSINGLEKRPKLRFPGFDEPWKATAFGDLVHEFSERTKEEDEDILLSAAIEGMFLNTELFGHQRGASNKGYKKIKYGTMVLSTQNLHLGNANVNQRFEHGMVSPAYKTYDITGCSVDLIAQWIKSEAAKRFFYNATTVGASVCRRNVEWDTLYEQPLYLPCLDEQEKVAKFLALLSDRINRQQQFVSALKKYKRGLLREIFAKLSERCEKRNLKEVSVLFADGDWIESKDQASGGIRLIQTGNVGFGVYLDKSQNAKYISEATFHRLNCLEIYDGDILISRLPEPAGRACLLPKSTERRITAVDCTVIRTDTSVIDRNYLLQFLCSEQYLKTVNSFLAGGTRQRISRKNLEGIEVPYPSIDKQRYYGRFLCKVDAHISNAEQSLSCLSKLRCFMLQQLFI